MTQRETMVNQVAEVLTREDPQSWRLTAEIATAVVLSYPMDKLHLAKDEKPLQRIREGKAGGTLERTDGWRAR